MRLKSRSRNRLILRWNRPIRDRREGWNVYYWVALPDVFRLLDSARAMVGGGATPKLVPTRLADCACPKCTAVADPAPGR